MPNGIVTTRMKQMIPAMAYPSASSSPPKISQRTFSTKRMASIMRVRRPVELVDLGAGRQRAGRTQATGGGGTGRARPPAGVDERTALAPADRERRGEGVPGGGAVHRVDHGGRYVYGLRVAAAVPGTGGAARQDHPRYVVEQRLDQYPRVGPGRAVDR